MRLLKIASSPLLLGIGFVLLRCSDPTSTPEPTPTGGSSGAPSTGGTSTSGTGGSAAGTPATGGAAGSSLQGGTGQGGASGAPGGAGQGGVVAGSGGSSSGAAGASLGGAGAGGASETGGAGGASGAGGGGAGAGGAGAGGASGGRAGASGAGGASGGRAGASGAGGCGTGAGTTFAAVQTILSRSCGTGSCHPSAQGTHINLRNTDGMLHTRLLGNVPTTGTDMQCRNRPLVVPCSPDTSLIVQMIEAPDGPRAGCAIRMPDDCPGERACLPDADIQTIRSWIAGGAPQ